MKPLPLHCPLTVEDLGIWAQVSPNPYRKGFGPLKVCSALQDRRDAALMYEAISCLWRESIERLPEEYARRYHRAVRLHWLAFGVIRGLDFTAPQRDITSCT